MLKNDPNYIQGIPDLIVLWNDMWASLEVKRSGDAAVQPNQVWYVEKMDEMSFSSFIYPENKESVLIDLQLYFHYYRKERGDDT